MKRTIKIKSSPEERVLRILKSILDPELNVNIVDLGLIYDMKIEGRRVKILMTFTNIACPLKNYILTEIKERLKSIGFDADVELTFNPPWSPERMNRKLRKKFGF